MIARIWRNPFLLAIFIGPVLLSIGLVALHQPPVPVTPPLGIATPSGSATPAGPSALPSASPSSQPSPTSLKPSPTTSTTTRAPASNTTEDVVLQMVNAERAKVDNCPSLHADSRLAAAARGHSQDMAVNNYFSHTSLDGSDFIDRIARAGYPRSQAAAENIAYGYSTAAAVMAGWMNSPGHRANILNCGLRAIGIGVATNSGGRKYWTQDFGRQ